MWGNGGASGAFIALIVLIIIIIIVAAVFSWGGNSCFASCGSTGYVVGTGTPQQQCTTQGNNWSNWAAALIVTVIAILILIALAGAAYGGMGWR